MMPTLLLVALHWKLRLKNLITDQQFVNTQDLDCRISHCPCRL